MAKRFERVTRWLFIVAAVVILGASALTTWRLWVNTDAKGWLMKRGEPESYRPVVDEQWRIIHTKKEPAAKSKASKSWHRNRPYSTR